jgi:DNA-directed RNA polymerase specialized sigma24 family protein
VTPTGAAATVRVSMSRPPKRTAAVRNDQLAQLRDVAEHAAEADRLLQRELEQAKKRGLSSRQMAMATGIDRRTIDRRLQRGRSGGARVMSAQGRASAYSR